MFILPSLFNDILSGTELKSKTFLFSLKAIVPFPFSTGVAVPVRLFLCPL